MARALGKDMDDLVVVILDRPRHHKLIEEVRRCGARIKLIPDGDVAAAVDTGFPDTGVDILYGIGGAPEGVLAAVALKCLGGEIQGRSGSRKRGAVVPLPQDGDRRSQKGAVHGGPRQGG